jgi:hypothetical protein
MEGYYNPLTQNQSEISTFLSWQSVPEYKKMTMYKCELYSQFFLTGFVVRI